MEPEIKKLEAEIRWLQIKLNAIKARVMEPVRERKRKLREAFNF
jgi:hypothetical protein